MKSGTTVKENFYVAAVIYEVVSNARSYTQTFEHLSWIFERITNVERRITQQKKAFVYAINGMNCVMNRPAAI